MSMYWELQGVAPPNPFDDAIDYHLWFDANECSECGGSGFVWELIVDQWTDFPCEDCEGTGFIPAVHEFLDDTNQPMESL